MGQAALVHLGCCDRIPEMMRRKQQTLVSHSFGVLCQQTQCLVRALVLLCRWPASQSTLTWQEVEGAISLGACTYKDTNPIPGGSTLMT